MPGLPDFVLVQHTKKWENVPNLPNNTKIDQMAIKCTNIFHRKTFQKLPKLGFLVLKYTIWQPWFM
jgi:hypothetical protein